MRRIRNVINETEENILMTYFDDFIDRNKYGIRFIETLLTTYLKDAKNVFKDVHDTLTMEQVLIMKENNMIFNIGTCIGWMINCIDHRKNKYEIDLHKLNTDKNSFLQFLQRLEDFNSQKKERQIELTNAFERHNISTASIDKYSYIKYGLPSIRETCAQVYELKWLHENTPFCEFVERNKRNRGFGSGFIIPDPYYNMTYNVCTEAKAMVLSLGYQCPPFEFIP